MLPNRLLELLERVAGEAHRLHACLARDTNADFGQYSRSQRPQVVFADIVKQLFLTALLDRQWDITDVEVVQAERAEMQSIEKLLVQLACDKSRHCMDHILLRSSTFDPGILHNYQ